MVGETCIDRTTFKIQVSVAVISILFLIGTAFAYGLWKQGVEDHLTKLEEKQDQNTVIITELQSENQELQIELAKINTQLMGIEAHLVDIKSDLKAHSSG